MPHPDYDKLPPGQRTVFNAAWRLCEEGLPPSFGMVADRSGIQTGHLKSSLDALISKEWLRQPYSRGPFLPLRDPEGNPFVWGLVRADQTNDALKARVRFLEAHIEELKAVVREFRQAWNIVERMSL